MVFAWIALALVCCLPVALSLFSVHLHQAQQERSSIVASQKLVYVLMSHLERTIEAIDAFMVRFSTVAVEAMTPQEIYRDLKAATLPASVIQLSWVAPDGKFVASNLSPPGNSIDLTDREHVRAHLEGTIGNEIFISKPVKGRVSQTWSIQFSRAVRDPSGRLLGILVASYEIAELIDFYGRLRTDDNAAVALLGVDGVVRARASGRANNQSAVGMNLRSSPIFSEMLEMKQGEYRALSPIDGIERIGYYMVSGRYPVVILVTSELANIIGQTREFQIASISTAAGLAVALLVLGFLVMRYNRLEQRLRAREVEANARQRESQFLDAFGKVPGISVVHVHGGVASPIGTARENAVDAHVRSPGFLSRLGTAMEPSVNVEHFTKDGEEYEVQYVVARLGEIGAVGGPAHDLMVFALDHTAKRMEENNLYQMSKMAALGELVTGLAHEINQPLGVIRLAAGNALSGMRRGLPREHVEEKLNRIIHQTDRMKAIIDHMRIFGRRSEFRSEPSLAQKAIEGAIQVVGAQIRLDDIALDARLSCDNGLKVPCRQELLEQVLINLLLNARDAIRSRRSQEPGLRGAIEISCGCDPAKVEGKTVRIVVRDNGGGIPDAIIGKVFQPFFTTKAAGHGTGLGLSVSFGIVRDHSGTLSVANDGEGAVFTITFPGLAPDEPCDAKRAS
ncbi:ATP-binding protein [Aquabacter spiritensis]|uniref:histidine kinase n=1 Tax=Aquabacter spiritensis TaxID=933073 RepID=A0A4R3M8D1_9HYPH|nr:ATP-binding protein [Aquabacter spiritensis]TCT07907.1 phospho-acceptor domain-containing protein [Aquabacter spiritensis]